MSEQVLGVLYVVMALAAVVLPGVFAVSAAWGGRPLRWRWITGATLGLAAAACTSYLLSYFDILLFPAIWLLMALGAVVWWFRSGRTGLVARPGPGGWILILALAVTGVLRVGMVTGREVPRGWDPAFHCILTQKILLTGKIITDWQPFETVALNYPVASHTLMAGISLVTDERPHAVFNVLIGAIGVFLAAEVYALAAAATGRRTIGLFAAILCGLVSVLGSVDYARWGGLPNAMGMIFLLGWLRLLIERGQAVRGRWWPMTVLVGGIILVHHHVMIVACALMGVLAIIALLVRNREMLTAVLASGVGGTLVALPHVLRYLPKAGELPATDTLSFEEQPPLWTWLGQLGWAFVTLSVVGIGWWIWQRSGRAKRHRVRMHWAIVVGIVLLLALYGVTGIAYPAIQAAKGKPALGAFTPSRFLTDAAPLLAIFAGCGAYAIVRARRLRVWHGAVAAMLLTLTIWPAWSILRNGDYTHGRVAAYEWINRNSPPRTVVYTRDAWAPYFTWRNTLRTPIPISEPQSFREDDRRFWAHVDQILEGKTKPADADLVIVRLRVPGEAPGPFPVLYHDEMGYAVEQMYPK